MLWRGEADECNDIGVAFDKWCSALWTALAARSSNTVGTLLDERDHAEEEVEYGSSDEEEEASEPLVDLEDLGSMMKKKAPEKPVFVCTLLYQFLLTFLI